MEANHKKLIEKTRSKIQNLMAEQDKLYKDLYKELNIEDVEYGEWLWDYVFNCTDDTHSPYLDMVRKKVFIENKEKQLT